MSALSCRESGGLRTGGWGRPGGMLRTLWQGLRQLTGDDAYERYLAHHHRHHPGAPVECRRTFWRREIERRWARGAQRCC